MNETDNYYYLRLCVPFLLRTHVIFGLTITFSLAQSNHDQTSSKDLHNISHSVSIEDNIRCRRCFMASRSVGVCSPKLELWVLFHGFTRNLIHSSVGAVGSTTTTCGYWLVCHCHCISFGFFFSTSSPSPCLSNQTDRQRDIHRSIHRCVLYGSSNQLRLFVFWHIDRCECDHIIILHPKHEHLNLLSYSSSARGLHLILWLCWLCLGTIVNWCSDRYNLRPRQSMYHSINKAPQVHT